MDAKEAVEEFNKYKSAGFNNYAQPSGMAVMLAFEALEKQVPVEIRTEIEGIYEPYDDVPIGRKVNLYCGKCGKPLNAYHNYCYWCGQAINNDKE